MTLATVLLVQLGIEVVDKDMQKRVEPRFNRGSSILRLGWKAVKTMFEKDRETLETLLSLLVLKELDFEAKLEEVFVSGRIDRERAMESTSSACINGTRRTTGTKNSWTISIS